MASASQVPGPRSCGPSSGFRVWVSGADFGVSGLGLRVCRFRVWDFRIEGLGLDRGRSLGLSASG